MTDAELNCKCYIAILEIIKSCANKWSLAHLKKTSTKYAFTNHIYIWYMYEQDLALNNIKRLIYNKTRPKNQPTNASLMPKFAYIRDYNINVPLHFF